MAKQTKSDTLQHYKRIQSLHDKISKVKVKVKVVQLCLTLPPHGVLEWVAFSFSRGSSQPRNWTGVSCIAGGFFTNWAMREAVISTNNPKLLNKQRMGKVLNNRSFQQTDRIFKRSRWELKTEKKLKDGIWNETNLMGKSVE